MRKAALILAALGAFQARAACAACEGPLGFYTGVAHTAGDTTKVSADLNIFCRHGSTAAQLFTSMGDFEVKGVSATDGHVSLTFDSGASLGTLELTASGKSLIGAFRLADDRGSASLSRAGEAHAEDAWTPRLDLTPAQWREDIAYFARELPKVHANAFFHISRAQFEAETRALAARAATGNGDEMLVGLQRVAKSIGDGHTGVFPRGMDRRVLPLEFAKFGDELRIVAAGKGYENLLGTRVLKIGGKPIAEVWTRVMTLTPQAELEQLRRQDALVYLARGYALHGLGVVPDRNRAVYTVQSDTGKASDTEVAALAPEQDATLKSAYPDDLLRGQNKDAAFWCTAIGRTRTVYCNWRGYQDLNKHAKEMFALLDGPKPAKLVLDMRDNGGGDNTVGDAAIVQPLKARADVNRKGRLYVLIGAETFSAAMNNAAQLQDETNAILVGERIGEKPNSYQEPRQFRLPNSHLIVRASTLWYEFRKKGPNVVAPDKEIVPTWQDVKAGLDPVLDWVLAQPAS
jgi:hypothetical protein